MKNFEIVSTKELQNSKGGVNEMTVKCTLDDCIV